MSIESSGRALPGRSFFVGAEIITATAACCAAVGLVVLTRLPFRTRYLLNWDAAQFALGVQNFDVVHHQPHPPGYPGYVLLGRLLSPLVGGPNTALVDLSIGGECVAVVLAYLFARSLFGAWAGVAAALSLALSPLYWYYGEAADTYALEPPLVLGAAWLCWRAWNGDRRSAVAAAVLLALGGSLRPSTAVLLGPLLLASLRQLGDRRTATRAIVAVIGLTAAWLLPLVILAGGAGAYLRASWQLGDSVTSSTAIWKAGWEGLRTTSGAVLLGTIWELGALAILVPFGLWVVPRLAPRLVTLPPGWAAFCWIWALPGLLTFLFIHIGQVVYVQIFTPALFLMAGPAVAAAAAAIGRPRLRNPALAAALVVNTAIFLLPATDSLAGQLRSHDTYVEQLVQSVGSFDPASTVLVADAYASGNYRMAQVYLPEYRRVAVARDQHGRVGEIYGDVYQPGSFNHASPLDLPPAATTYVFLDLSVAWPLVADFGDFTVVKMKGGSRLYVWAGPPPSLFANQIWLASPFRSTASLLP